MTTCPRCGLDVTGLNAANCPRCGQPLTLTSAQDPAPPSPQPSPQPGQAVRYVPGDAPTLLARADSSPGGSGDERSGASDAADQPMGSDAPTLAAPTPVTPPPEYIPSQPQQGFGASGYAPPGAPPPAAPQSVAPQAGFGAQQPGYPPSSAPSVSGYPAPAAPAPYGQAGYGQPGQPGYPPAYPPQGYPQQPNYPPQGYPQPGYPQPGAYPQQGYPQPGYPQPAPQPGYPAPGYPAPAYPAPGYPPVAQPQRGGAGRIIAIVVGVIVALALIVGGLAAAISKLSGGSQGSTVYHSSLSSDDNQWTTQAGQCDFQNGGYQTNGVICYYSPSVPSDVSVAVDAKQTDGDTTGGYGISIRRASTGNRYFFEINSSGQFAFVKDVSDTPTALDGPAASSAIRTGTNTTNTLKVTAKGSHFDLYINGTKVGQADDSTYSSGDVGLGSAEGTTARFNNITISHG